jgi:hypothetical protein
LRRLIAHRFLVMLGALALLSGLIAAYIILFSPLRLPRLQGYFLRWGEFFVWLLLIPVQFGLLATLLEGPTYWLRAWREFNEHAIVKKLRLRLDSPTSGMILLGLSFLIGLTKIYYGRFVDEGDVLTLGWLIARGDTLYEDVFAHHFPLPYYWIALVVRLFGNSFVAARVSVLGLQLGVFGLGMVLTRDYLAVGLASLAWNLINQFLRGQEVIYATFEGIFLAGAFILILHLLTSRQRARPAVPALSGALLAAAVLSDPLMVYPAGAAALGLFASGLRVENGPNYREALRRALIAGTVAALIFAIFAAQLFISGTADEFYHSTIWFNAEIYAKYVDANPNRFGPLIENLATGLHVFDSRWRQYTSAFMPMDTYRSVRMADENAYASWIYAGLLFRLSILACGLGLILNRGYAAGVFVYVFAAALMVRQDAGLYAIGFTLVSLLAGFYALVHLRHPVALRSQASGTKRGSGLRRFSAGVWLAALVVIAFMQAWSAFRGGYFIFDHRFEFRNDRHITLYDQFGDEFSDFACGRQGLELTVLPINPLVHFVSGIPPASRYVWMYPWVAEIGQDELISDLRNNPSAIVWVNVDRGSTEENSAARYLADTIAFLDEEYVTLADEFWMSPELAQRCPPDDKVVPFSGAEQDEE